MCRQRRQAQWTQLSLAGLVTHDVGALHEEPDYPAARSRARYTNVILRLIYPQGEAIPPSDIVALFRAGQVAFVSPASSG